MKILLLADCMERYHFFYRIYKALEANHYVIIGTTEPLAFILGKYNKLNITYIPGRLSKPRSIAHDEIKFASSKSIEFLNEEDCLEIIEKQAKSFSENIISILQKHSIERVIIWNGQQLLGRAATIAAEKIGVPRRYIEISNLPNKLFSDKSGVNALSSIYNDISIIDNLEAVPEEEHEEWMANYFESKKMPLPQAHQKTKSKIEGALNLIFKVILRDASIYKIVNRFKMLSGKKINLKAHTENELPIEFVFLPLQVSSDTQVKLHSSIDNIGAIRYAAERSSALGVKLVVKIHPAEKSKHEIARIIAEKQHTGFLLTEENTTEIIRKSRLIITINSTVGLEAMLLHKEVITLGRCVYQEFNTERVKKYIHRYLINGIDYFSSSSIDMHSAEKILFINT